MVKKRRKKKHVKKVQKRPQPKQMSENGVKHKRFIPLIGVVAALIAIFLLLYFSSSFYKNVFFDSGSGDNSDVSIYGDSLPFPPIKQKTSGRQIQYSDFVGSDSCLACHIEQYEVWRNSTHGRAGGEPGNVKIVGKFDSQPLYFKDAIVIPSITRSGDYIFTVKQQNLPNRIVKVHAVVGGGHMEGGGTQTFFTKLADGTLRFVAFDYNKTNDIWFVQLRDRTWVPISKEISINNLYNWPPLRILGTYDRFSNCQNCHGSQIFVEYDLQNKQYHTKYTTLQINCESCHGPGKRHIELVRTANLDTLTDIGIIVLSTANKDESINKCFECHAAKAALTNDFLSGKSPEEHYALKFPILTGERFFPDGRVRSFAYQINHLFSDCYINGSMTCVDCHDPHSLTYRDVFWRPLAGKFDDGQCVDCHPSKAKAPEKHSYHKPNSPGNVCTACHMPFLQHPMLGNSVRFARSDHIIPIPRPAYDAQLGIENACLQCHWDKSIAWLQEKTDEWYGKIKPHNQAITNNQKAQEVSDISEAAHLQLNPDANFPIAQVTGIFDFIKRFLKPNMQSLNPEIITRLKKLTKNSDIDIKALALAALHLAADHNEDIHKFLVENLQTFENQEIAIRYRWAFVMDYLGTLFALKRDYTNAIQAYQKSLEIKSSDIYTLINLAVAYRNTGDYSKAINTFKKAIQIEPNYAQIYFRLAQVYITSQQKQEAIEVLKEGLKYDPNDQNARRMLQQLQS